MRNDRYQIFLFRFLALFVVFPLLLIAFNYSVDPNHRYRFSVPSGSLHRLARSEDLVLTLPKNYDDRALLKKFIPQAVPPRILVMGGSRVLNIQSEMFRSGAGPLLDTAVMAGTIRDYVALWQLVKRRGRASVLLHQ